jgi:hypothetical protein
MIEPAECGSRDEMLYQRAVLKQQITQQRLILVQAMIKMDQYLVDVENETLHKMRDRLREMEKHIELYLPGARVA